MCRIRLAHKDGVDMARNCVICAALTIDIQQWAIATVVWGTFGSLFTRKWMCCWTKGLQWNCCKWKFSYLLVSHLLLKYLRMPSARLKSGPTVVPNTVTLESIAPRQAPKLMKNPASEVNVVEAILTLTSTEYFLGEVVFLAMQCIVAFCLINK